MGKIKSTDLFSANEFIIFFLYICYKKYHSKKIKKAPKVLDVSILKNMKYIDPETTIESLLSYYCIQAINEEDIKKFKIDK